MESFDKIWEDVHSNYEWGSYPTEHVIRFIARNYYNKNRKEVKILDYGCGGGAHTWYLAREGFDVYAFDGSKSAIELVERRLAKDNMCAKLCVSDALHIDYPDYFFDAIIDNVCIYGTTYGNIRKMYKKTYDMLKIGGMLLTSCFGKETDGYGTGTKIEKDTFADIQEGALIGRGTTHFYTRETLRDCLEEAGYIDVMIDRILYTDRGIQIEQFVAVGRK